MQVPIFTEIVVHSAASDIQKIPTPQGTMYLMKFVQPNGVCITIKLDDAGKDALVEGLTGVSVAPAQGIIIPR